MARERTCADAYIERRLLKRQNAAIGKTPEERPKTRVIFDGEFERAQMELPGGVSRIFVGNLNHTVSHKTLVRVFKVCGPIRHTTINCFKFRKDATIFAEIIFNDPGAAEKSMSLDGLLLEGLALVICKELPDLPEWKESERSKGVNEKPAAYQECGSLNPSPSLDGSSRTVVGNTSRSASK